MLRLVPPPDATPPAKRGRRGSTLRLTADEQRHLAAALRNIARTYPAGMTGLARALGVDRSTLRRTRYLTPAVAVAVWRLHGVPVEVLLRGQLAAIGGRPRATPPPAEPA